MQTLEVDPGQIFALQVRRILAEIDSPVEIRWCLAHGGIAGNEEADQCAKIAAGKQHEHGVEWLTLTTELDVCPCLTSTSLKAEGREEMGRSNELGLLTYIQSGLQR